MLSSFYTGVLGFSAMMIWPLPQTKRVLFAGIVIHLLNEDL